MNYRNKINDLLLKHRLAIDTVKIEKKNLFESEDQLTYAEEAQNILQHISQAIQQEAHNRISDVVSRCLEAIFDEPYTFMIKFERKRGKTEARLIFERNGLEIDPLTASGGGVIDVAAFALRLACLILTRPHARRLLILDEPFRFVSSEYRSRVKSLLETLAEEMNIQFVQVTHINALRCGKVIEIES